MEGFFKNRPACGRKNAPGQRVWFKRPKPETLKEAFTQAVEGDTFSVSMGGRRAPRSLTYSMDHLVVETGWVRFNHRLERKRRAL